MTIRTIINKKKRMISIITYTGFAFFAIGIFVSERSDYLPLIPLIGFAVAFLSILYAFFGIRCPRCNGQFGYIAMYLGTPFSISKKIKYCPFCGVDIDTELKKQKEV